KKEKDWCFTEYAEFAGMDRESVYTVSLFGDGFVPNDSINGVDYVERCTKSDGRNLGFGTDGSLNCNLKYLRLGWEYRLCSQLHSYRERAEESVRRSQRH